MLASGPEEQFGDPVCAQATKDKSKIMNAMGLAKNKISSLTRGQSSSNLLENTEDISVVEYKPPPVPPKPKKKGTPLQLQ